MRKFILMAVCIWPAGLLSAQDAQQTTVSYVKSKAKHYDNVILQGKITRQIDDEFILADNTGSIVIELEDQAEHAMYQYNLGGATVRVYGVVDKDHQWDNVEVKVLKIQVVGQAENQPAASATISTGDEVNMQGRDDITAFGHHGGPAVNIPDNF